MNTYLFANVKMFFFTVVVSTIPPNHHSHIGNSGQLLNLVQQQIPLLDHLFVLGILRVWPVGHDGSGDLVDLGREPARGNEPGQLQVEELGADPKGRGHRLEGDGLVRVEELAVSENDELPDDVVCVSGEVSVAQQRLFYVCDGLHVAPAREGLN